MEIKTLKLHAKNIVDQEAFYREVMGFPCENMSNGNLRISTKENTLVFEQSTKNVYYHFAFLIPTGTLPAAIRYLEARNIELLPYKGSKIIPFTSGQSIYFFDKDDNIVEFIERPTLNYPAQNSFSIRDVIKLNEIGLPVQNPLEMAQQLTAQYGIEPIDEMPLRDVFAWVGDYHGVIIVVKEGRKWLPTDKPGIVNDFSIHYTTKGREFRLKFTDNSIEPWVE